MRRSCIASFRRKPKSKASLRCPPACAGLTLLTICFVFAANAVVFHRDILTIIPKAAPEIIIEGDSAEPNPTPREPIQFYTEIRGEEALRNNWVVSLNRISEQSTMMIVFDPPRYDIIERQPVYQPLDIISITPQGVITQIIPNLDQSQLAGPIESPKPVKARLILMGGAAEHLGLRPGDRAEHPHFNPGPKVVRE